jgi:putative Holliday junction resolvase
MSKIVGIDVGDVRVGISILDSAAKIAFPYKTVPRAQGSAEKEIIKLIERENASAVVAGLPLSDDGIENMQCEKVRQFCRRLSRRITIPIEFQDEFASTAEASALLRGKNICETVDAHAATLILQRYADEKL